MIRSLGNLSLDSPPSPSSVSRTPPEIWGSIIRFATKMPRSYAEYTTAMEVKVDPLVRMQEEREKLAGNAAKLKELNDRHGAVGIAENMATCALVCKEWNAFATPLLFRIITLYGIRSTLKFIRLVQSNPSLGHHVHELEFDISAMEEAQLWNPSSNPGRYTLATLLELVPNLKVIAGGTALQEELRAPQLLAALYILHPRTPLLALLDVEISENNYQVFTQAMTRLSSSLQKIRLTVTHFTAPPSLAIETIEQTTFPHLHTLVVQLVGCPSALSRMGVPNQPTGHSPLLFDLLSHWIFPSLRSADFHMCCAGRNVSPEDFFVRNGSRIEELTWDHHTANPTFLEHIHLLPALRTLVCHPFKIVTREAREVRNLERVETLIVSDYNPLDFMTKGLDKRFFKKIDGKTMPGLKTVVLEPGHGMNMLWRRFPQWKEKLKADGIKYLEVE